MGAASVFAQLPWYAWIVLVHVAVTLFLNTFTLPEPYMDEIFHVPQAQAYCRGEFYQWDPKITTPPGLYMYSNIVLRPLSLLPSENPTTDSTLVRSPWWCTTQYLRWTNTILSTCIYLVLVPLFRTLHPGRTDAQAALSAFVLSWFPVLFSTSFLYYTDIGSTLAVLFAYLLGLQRNYWASALVSLVALFFRQSNIAWTAFIVAVCLSNALAADPRTQTRYRNPLAAEVTGIGDAFKTLISFVRLCLTDTSTSATVGAPYFLVFAAFTAFVYMNGGSIVLGDRANHQLSLHVPQLFYLAVFTVVFAATGLLKFDSLPRFVRFIGSCLTRFRCFVYLTLSLASMIAAVHYCTIHHPFILSDNRHYSFYVWKNIYRKHAVVPYALVPIYFAAGWLYWIYLAIQQSVVWCVAYACTVALTLVPTPLLEFRYFILPYLMYRLHIRQPSRVRLLAEILLYMIVNMTTTYLFFAKPFTWPSEAGKLQRFMW